MLTATEPLNLTQAEVDEICEPLVSPSAQVRYLERLGLLVGRKPNGRALVARSEYERVRGAARHQTVQAAQQSDPLATPNRAALLQVIGGGRRGTKTQGQ